MPSFPSAYQPSLLRLLPSPVYARKRSGNALGAHAKSRYFALAVRLDLQHGSGIAGSKQHCYVLTADCSTAVTQPGTFGFEKGGDDRRDHRRRGPAHLLQQVQRPCRLCWGCRLRDAICMLAGLKCRYHAMHPSKTSACFASTTAPKRRRHVQGLQAATDAMADLGEGSPRSLCYCATAADQKPVRNNLGASKFPAACSSPKQERRVTPALRGILVETASTGLLRCALYPPTATHTHTCRNLISLPAVWQKVPRNRKPGAGKGDCSGGGNWAQVSVAPHPGAARRHN